MGIRDPGAAWLSGSGSCSLWGGTVRRQLGFQSLKAGLGLDESLHAGSLAWLADWCCLKTSSLSLWVSPCRLGFLT